MVFHERGHEIKEGFLTQNDRNRNPQQTLRSLLRLSQHLLSFLQEIQRLLALAEVLPLLRSQGDAPRGTLRSETPRPDSSTDNRRLTVEIGIPSERAARVMLSNWATLTNIRMLSRSAIDALCH